MLTIVLGTVLLEGPEVWRTWPEDTIAVKVFVNKVVQGEKGR